MASMTVDKQYLSGRIQEIRQISKQLSKTVFQHPFTKISEDEKYSLRYHVIVLAEALGSLCLHIALEDFEEEPASYSDCLRLIYTKSLAESIDDLISIIRLRNLLVHRYWVIDDEKVYQSIKEDFHELESLLRRVEKKYEISTEDS